MAEGHRHRVAPDVAWLWPPDSESAYAARLPDGPIAVLPAVSAVVWEMVRDGQADDVVSLITTESGLAEDAAAELAATVLRQLLDLGLVRNASEDGWNA